MQVDRGRFLVLAASVAACTGPKPASDGPPKVAVPIETEPADLATPAPEVPPEPRVVDPVPVRDPRAALREACQELRTPPGPHCESFADTARQCESYGDILEPEAAEDAVACLSRKSGRQEICDFEAVGKCFLEGMKGSPSQPNARHACRQVVSGCAGRGWSAPEMTQAHCEAAIAGVRDEMDDTLVACMTEGCGIASCIWTLSSQ
jgi:hypothetical protein